MTVERRAVEFRATAAGVIEGVLIPYGTASRIGGVFDEVFEPGSVRFDRVMANVQHDRARPLARLGHGLTLKDSRTELRARIELPDTGEGRDTRALIEAGVLTGLSAEFRAVREEWPAPDRRVIHEAELRGLAVVDDPGHEGAIIDEVRRRGERRTWVRGGIRYGVESFCECLSGECSRVLFRPKALGPADGGDILALTGRASEAVGSTRGGTLRLRNTDEALEWELDRAGRDTAAGKTLRDLSQAKVPVYGRPLIDDDASTFTEAGAVRTYSKAVVRALLLKPIAGDKALRDGWDPITIDGETVKRRARVWL